MKHWNLCFASLRSIYYTQGQPIKPCYFESRLDDKENFSVRIHRNLYLVSISLIAVNKIASELNGLLETQIWPTGGLTTLWEQLNITHQWVTPALIYTAQNNLEKQEKKCRKTWNMSEMECIQKALYWK